MLSNRIADAFQIQTRFLRSTNLEQDFGKTDALRGYVLTTPARGGLERLVQGLAPRSGQRAWRITGDYGTGKSSFALALAHLMAGQDRGLPSEFRSAVDFRSLGSKRPKLLPVLVTGSRVALAQRLVEAVEAALDAECNRGKPPRILSALHAAAASKPKAPLTDARCVELLTQTACYLRDSGRASGLLIILDELGKFLEFAAQHPDRQDIFLLQTLAEAASRSADAPLFVVGILHQGFQAYAEQLSLAAQKEWEKVAGRYEEILFNQPLEQTTSLVANALNIRRTALPRGMAGLLQDDMARAVEIGWFGPAAVRKSLMAVAPDLYPMHPSVLPVLVRLFGRFGQNERSLYSFLLSNEPNALQSFSQQAPRPQLLYRLHDLYDYARAAFGHRLALQSFRSHWNQIESVVESYPKDQELELRILKTVALLNLLDSTDLLATADTLALAVGGSAAEASRKVKNALKDLQKGKSVLYYRGAAGGHCLWPHTSVNLERAYQEASEAVPVPGTVAPFIRERLETRPLVARRHYIETGNLRHFSVVFSAPDDLSQSLSASSNADGLVVVALCETEPEREKASAFAQSKAVSARKDVLVAVPQPLIALAPLIAQVQRWEWVRQNTPELNHDSYAQEEVSRQLTACKQVLEKRLQGCVGLRQFGRTLGLDWFYRAQAVSLKSGRDLLERLSQICDESYQLAPRIQNELVNRRTLSSAAAAARLRLIEHILRSPGEVLLGMDAQSKPPEMSMYLSVLQAAGLHHESDDAWSLDLPKPKADSCNIRPFFDYIQETLEAADGARVPVTRLFDELRRPPFGVRDGMLPLLLAVFAVMHDQDVAFYEKGGFIKQPSGQEFHRLLKQPETFEIQYCRIAGVRQAVFQKLFKVLNPEAKASKKVDLLAVVRPLCQFAAQLVPFAQRTASLSPESRAVRDALLRAEEPATLVFRTLPEACKCERFESDESPSPKRVRTYVERLRAALDELRAAYPDLLSKMKANLSECFERPGDFEKLRTDLALTATKMQFAINEPRLKTFSLRVADNGLREQEWLESLGSFICAKPPSKWLDADAVTFQDELRQLARQFKRVESMAFAGGTSAANSLAMRVSITCQDGTEVDEVLHLDPAEESRVGELELEFARLVGSEQRLGVLAATRAIRTHLQQLKN